MQTPLWIQSVFLMSLAIGACGQNDSSREQRSGDSGNAGLEDETLGGNQLANDDVNMVSGFDLNGQAKSCSTDVPEIACTLVYGPEEQFADDCRSAGYEVTTCGCHDYMCSAALPKLGDKNPNNKNDKSDIWYNVPSQSPAQSKK